MEKRDEADDEMDEFMLPGFRFHPTDQELVGFYLTRKIQQKPVCIELIKQLDIYKYDPWDLSMFATNGEKEWYFYCPRDRKYRNSTRPNRVTRSGFWKATGTDRSIYSTQSSKCIGLKKSLVFYKGKAAKGTKTDWMMHEFRLPSLSDSTNSPNRYFANNIPASEAWAICRIFKKANSSTKRALSHSWASPASDSTNPANSINNIQFCSSSIIMANKANTILQFSFCNDIQHSSMECKSSSVPLLNGDHFKYPISHTFSSSECAINDASSLLSDMSTSILCDYENGSDNMELSTFYNQFDGLSATLSEDMHENLNFGYEEERSVLKEENVGLGSVVRSIELPCSFALSSPDLMWDSSPSPCHYSTFPLTSAILE